MNKLIVWICVLFLLASFVSAVPPVTTVFTGTTSLTIEVPVAQYIKQNQDAKLHTHVFNSSNGLTVRNDTTSCYLHLYNSTGSHILESNMGWDSNNEEFKLDIGGGNFSELEMNSFILVCNSTNEGGFVRGGYDITVTGVNGDYNNYSFLAVIGVFIFFIILVLIGLFKAKQDWLKTVCVLSLSLLTMSLTRFLGWFIEITNPNEIQLIDTMTKMYMFSVWGFRIVLIASVFILLIMILNVFKNIGKETDSWFSKINFKKVRSK